MENTELIKQVSVAAQIWLDGNYDAETKSQVKAMLNNDDKTDLIDSFYRTLEFGTGGLRGIMGVGTNRMNIYTVGAATQGFANYLKKQFASDSQISVVIGHDCRNNSQVCRDLCRHPLGQWHQGLSLRCPPTYPRSLFRHSGTQG